MQKRDQEKDMEVIAKAMMDETELPVVIAVKEAWLLVSGMQLLCRHPEIGIPMKQLFEHIGREFQSAVVEAHPEVAELIEMGWDEAFDVDKDGNPVVDAD